MSVKLAPSEFGKLHRKLFEDVVGGRAKQLGAKALTDRLALDVGYSSPSPDAKLIYDNVTAVRETRNGNIPLTTAFELDEQLATASAAQAARATGGTLTEESAKYLPELYRSDFERLTGAAIDSKPGIAVKGVSLTKGPNNAVEVKIDFKQALAGVTADRAVLAVGDHFVLVADRVNPAKDANLPPYSLSISPRAGAMWGDTWLTRQNGLRGFADPAYGSLLSAGSETMKLTNANQTKTYETLTFTLDQVNELGSAGGKPPSSETKAIREGWRKHFKSDGFDFSAALRSGKLQEKSLAEARTVPGIKVLLSEIRQANNQSITGLVNKGLLAFYVDPKTDSFAALVTYQGESGGKLYVMDQAKDRWVGTFDFGDDGTIEWLER